MTPQIACLVDYLTLPNPSITYSPKFKKGENTLGDYFMVDNISIWEGFTIESLLEMYGSLLWRRLTHEQLNTLSRFDVPDAPYCEIWNENSLENLLAFSSQWPVNCGLVLSQKLLAPPSKLPSKCISMARGGQTESTRSLQPDWAGKNEITNSNLLPGDTKLARKWSSDKIPIGKVPDEKPKANWLRPLRQLSSYCMKHQCRYGYIITEEELVALRVSAAPGARRSVRMVEFQSVPWKNNSADGISMTVNLALWWLHMLALGDTKIEDVYDSADLSPSSI